MNFKYLDGYRIPYKVGCSVRMAFYSFYVFLALFYSLNNFKYVKPAEELISKDFLGVRSCVGGLYIYREIKEELVRYCILREVHACLPFVRPLIHIKGVHLY